MDHFPENKKSTPGVLEIIIRLLVFLALVGVFLFLPAGRLDWWHAWALIGVFLVCVMILSLVLREKDPALAAERSSIAPDEGTQAWDKPVLLLFQMSFFAAFVTAGLDVRFGWTGPLPLVVPLLALAAVIPISGLVLWSMLRNPFFTGYARIQEERGQRVASAGPYRCVRHPGYLGMSLFTWIVPLALGSLWALIPGGIGFLALVVRTALEDRMLREELEGYPEYAARVRYRLIPGVW